MTRVLLVEDNLGDARLIEELLREVPGHRYTITHATTLAEALGLVDHQDVALLDLTLPDSTGITGVERMTTASRALPIVVLTGNAAERVAIEALSAGAQDYLRKDEIVPALLAKALSYAIERKKLSGMELAQHGLQQAISRANFIADVAHASTSSLDAETCGRAVVPLLVPRLGEGCAIDLVRDGRRQRIASIGPTATPPELTVPLIARGREIGALLLWGWKGVDEDRLLTEELCRPLALAFDNATLYTDAHRAIRGRDEMLAIVSHDLRNPLGVVELSLSMIESDPKRLQTALPRAARAVERMRLLIEDLLQISQIDAGTLVIQPQAIELTPLLDDIYEQHRMLAQGKGVEVHRELAPLLGSAHVDPNRMAQALANLLGNAIKFTPPSGMITLAAAQTSRGVEISVTDTGPGIPSDQVGRIFDRFWQADRRRRDGVGLGLPIAKGIVDAHGGVLDVRSELGRGTTFRITLPSNG
ncbi:MAG: ATP-binding protein [Deltaproteobacteria bacterium]